MISSRDPPYFVRGIPFRNHWVVGDADPYAALFFRFSYSPRLPPTCRILAGAVIKNAVIGDNFIAYENSVVGNYTFTFAVDEDGNKQRIPSMGKAIIGNNVELGCHSTISAGSTGNTVVEDYVKTAACVHIAHDCHVKKNAELISGTVLGGFSVIGEGAVLGLNSTVKNRVSLGDRVIVGMGSAVLKEVPEDVTVVGSPARILGKN